MILSCIQDTSYTDTHYFLEDFMNKKFTLSLAIVFITIAISGCGKVAKETSSSDSNTKDTNTGYTVTEKCYNATSNALENTNIYSYDSSSKLLRWNYDNILYSNKGSVGYTYSNGKIIKQDYFDSTGTLTDSTQYTYNASGFLISATDSSGTAYYYPNGSGLITEKVVVNGGVTDNSKHLLYSYSADSASVTINGSSEYQVIKFNAAITGYSLGIDMPSYLINAKGNLDGGSFIFTTTGHPLSIKTYDLSNVLTNQVDYLYNSSDKVATINNGTACSYQYDSNGKTIQYSTNDTIYTYP